VSSNCKGAVIVESLTAAVDLTGGVTR